MQEEINKLKQSKTDKFETIKDIDNLIILSKKLNVDIKNQDKLIDKKIKLEKECEDISQRILELFKSKMISDITLIWEFFDYHKTNIFERDAESFLKIKGLEKIQHKFDNVINFMDYEPCLHRLVKIKKGEKRFGRIYLNELKTIYTPIENTQNTIIVRDLDDILKDIWTNDGKLKSEVELFQVN